MARGEGKENLGGVFAGPISISSRLTRVSIPKQIESKPHLKRVQDVDK